MAVSFSDISSSWIIGQEDEAYKELSPYYDRLLSWAKGDVEKAKKRMQEDYDRGLRIRTEDVATAIQRATEDTGIAHEGVNEKLQLANDTLKNLDNIQFPFARKVLLAAFNNRGIFNSGIKEEGVVKQQSEQGLQREAQTNEISGYNRQNKVLDIALERTKTDENLGLNRWTEEAGIQKSRQGEDLDTQLERKTWELEQQRRTEAAQLSASRLNRQVAQKTLDRLYG